MECGGCLGKLWIPARFTAGAGMRNNSMTARRARGFWTPPLKRGLGGFWFRAQNDGASIQTGFSYIIAYRDCLGAALSIIPAPPWSSFPRKRESRGPRQPDRPRFREDMHSCASGNLEAIPKPQKPPQPPFSRGESSRQPRNRPHSPADMSNNGACQSVKAPYSSGRRSFVMSNSHSPGSCTIAFCRACEMSMSA